ncbi:polysaccharide deacetylase family protein [Dokdonella sp.]|uniref:polysaccharide deacetylase family protein n=1 Tax=Dokdonella sp. TaxID=2291710 RepID=UPI00352729A0
MRIPILTYHSLNGADDSYGSNDHVALAADLNMIYSMDGRIVSLRSIVEEVLAPAPSSPKGKLQVAITFDDGANSDFIDFHHPEVGTYASFFNIIRASRLYKESRYCRDASFATSFVIASPEARWQLDHTCIAGRDDWRDDWWLSAAETDVLSIANHSWDHLHPTLSSVAQKDQKRGSFFDICDKGDADIQVLGAQDYIESKVGKRAEKLFAYPYGHVSEYLRDIYFPQNSDRILAAFSTAGEYVTETSNRWALPRFVCGDHWKNPDQLQGILEGACQGEPDTGATRTPIA